MAEVKVFYDRQGKTLTVWFADRSLEYLCEETGDEVVLIQAGWQWQRSWKGLYAIVVDDRHVADPWGTTGR